MAKKKKKLGRPKLPGQLYHLYIRYRPGIDPPELGQLLEAFNRAKGQKRADILRAALINGADQAQKTAASAESSRTASLLDEMFAAF